MKQDSIRRVLIIGAGTSGWLGMKSGRGFYTYPNPAFQRPDFISTPGNGA